MNTAKHTPGPWRIEEGTTLVWGHCNSDDLSDRGMGYPIAEARITPISNWALGRPDADAGEANARLIAAAPDLMEACDFALTILEALGNGKGDAAMACRAALAKARGEG